MEKELLAGRNRNGFQPARSKWYYIWTILIVLFCYVFVYLQRNSDIPQVPLLFTAGGMNFSTTDFFVIVVTGICGPTYSICGFIFLFLLEILFPGGGTSSSTYFALFVYVLLILLSAYFTRKRWFQGVKKPILAVLVYILVLGSSLYFVMAFLLDDTIYDTMSPVQMYVGIIPEVVLAVVALCAYYRFLQDDYKKKIGLGFLYTREYQEIEKNEMVSTETVLGHKMSNLTIIQTILTSIFAVFVYNLQMRGMLSDNMPDGQNLLILDIQLVLLISCIAFPISVFTNEVGFRLVVRPMNQMTSIMKLYFSAGEHARQASVEALDGLQIHTGDEIQELYEALCLMVSDMSGYIDAMHREMELKQDLAAAEAESKAKSTFLSSMSHEIRTPINAVLGMDEMILRESREEAVLEYAENIRTAGNSLLGLINDILDFSKIEAGKMDIIPVEYEFAPVLNDLVNMIKQRAEKKGLELIVQADEQIPGILYGDEIRFKQVVTNILTNAVKYTEKGSITISVNAEKAGEDAVFLYVAVKDTGIGIKEEDIKKLFSAFERIEEERNRNIEGTGLGMNITKQLLSMMDSQLEVESEYGKGSVFSFRLKQNVVKWEPIGDFKKALKRSLTNRKRYRESFTAPDARVLVVDDTMMNLTVFKGLLKQTRVQIDTAESGAECLEKITKAHYDLIFLDHRMPKMDGVETKQRMTGLSGNLSLDTPVVALTANAVSGAREEYLGYGFTDYLAKPIDAGALEKMMIRYLPEEKVLLREETGEDAVLEEGKGDKKEEALGGLETALPDVEGLDWNYAGLHLPGTELLKTALTEFYEVISLHADRLENYYQKLPEKEAWEEYRILVHGMKSSAATVGIIPLAGMAKILEYAAGAKDLDRVSRVHGVFLEEWRSYEEKLSGVFDIGAEVPVTGEMYDPDIVKGLLSIIQKSMEDFDVDRADAAMEQLKSFQYPEELQREMKALQAAIVDVDSDAVSGMIGKIKDVI